MNLCTIERNIILSHKVTINAAMTTNAVDEQHIRGWRELQSMIQGARENHGCCEIDDHRMIILGGYDGRNILSSSFIYDERTKQSTPLPNNIPNALCGFSAVANERYLYVIGGCDADRRAVKTLYRLSLETYEWTTLAPMGTTRYECAAVLLDDYIYIFGGSVGGVALASVERYSIVDDNWVDLPDMAAARWSHCAVAAMRNEIYILGGGPRVIEVFDTALLEWRTDARLCNMPRLRRYAAAVVLKNRYLVVIGGLHEEGEATARCLIYNYSINHWSSTPDSMNMITARYYHTAAVLDGKIVVAGGCSDEQFLSSIECIDARDILEYAPLEYPLQDEYFNQILQLGKALLITKHT